MITQFERASAVFRPLLECLVENAVEIVNQRLPADLRASTPVSARFSMGLRAFFEKDQSCCIFAAAPLGIRTLSWPVIVDDGSILFSTKVILSRALSEARRATVRFGYAIQLRVEKAGIADHLFQAEFQVDRVTPGDILPPSLIRNCCVVSRCRTPRPPRLAKPGPGACARNRKARRLDAIERRDAG